MNYNRKFIKNYFVNAISLTNLTKKNTPWIWKFTKEKSFQNLKLKCLKKPVLKMYDSRLLSRVEIDASDLVIDACFSQEHEDMWHLVTYLSRKLLSAEQNYDVHDKKLLAIVASLKSWRIYIEESSELTILTNHKNLVHFIIIKQLNRRQIRWLERLEQYKFKIQYILDKDNDRADALSRRSDHIETKKSFNHNILKVNKNESLLANKHELNAILRILRDDKKEFSIKKKKLQISIDKIDECIKEHHDESLQGHSGVTKTLQLLRQNC